MFFAKSDALGNETVAPRLIASTKDDTIVLNHGGFWRLGARIIEASGGFLAAWTEEYEGVTEGPLPLAEKGAWSVVRLTRLDAQGQPTGTTATMRAPEAEIDEVEPVLTSCLVVGDQGVGCAAVTRTTTDSRV